MTYISPLVPVTRTPHSTRYNAARTFYILHCDFTLTPTIRCNFQNLRMIWCTCIERSITSCRKQWEFRDRKNKPFPLTKIFSNSCIDEWWRCRYRHVSTRGLIPRGRSETSPSRAFQFTTVGLDRSSSTLEWQLNSLNQKRGDAFGGVDLFDGVGRKPGFESHYAGAKEGRKWKHLFGIYVSVVGSVVCPASEISVAAVIQVA